MPKILAVYKRIADLKKRYYASAQGKEALLKILGESEISEQVYNSNAIENSTLSLDETEKILLEIDLDRFIAPRELFEAKNLARVVEYTATKATSQDLTLEQICFLHKMLMSNIDDTIAGRFRTTGEYVKVGSHIAAAPEDIETFLHSMLQHYHTNDNVHIIKRIAKLHLTFEHIHPFVDGNGRIGRVINDYLLIRDGFVPINIRFSDRSTYYDAFKAFDTKGDTTIMEEIIGKAITNSYHRRLAYLENKEIITLSEYSKRTSQVHSGLINKAKRQTIEAFKENGQWKIGV